MRVGIVGGGLAGMALAGLLERRGLAYTVLERAPEWKRLGYGIGLWATGTRVLDELGVAGIAYAAGKPLDRVTIRKPGGRKVTTYRIEVEGRVPLLILHRADLHAALREAVPSSAVRLGTAPRSITESRDGVAVTLPDGTTETFDLLVGADGVHSTVRERCFDARPKRETDVHVWAFWVPERIDLPDTTTWLWSPGSEALATSIHGRGLITLAAHRRSRGPVPGLPEEELLEETAERMGWVVPEAVAACEEGEIFSDTVTTVRPFDWARDRIVLIGDAAHALNPISDMGGSLALKDASSLAAALSDAGSPEEAIAAYTRERAPAIRRAQRQAGLVAWLALSRIPGVPSLCRGAMKVARPVVEPYLSRKLRPYAEALDPTPRAR